MEGSGSGQLTEGDLLEVAVRGGSSSPIIDLMDLKEPKTDETGRFAREANEGRDKEERVGG